jgi:hypothetical protein
MTERPSFAVAPDHEHEWRPLRHQRAPTGPPPEHTAFEVLICACGVYVVFPRSNYALALPEFQRVFVAGMLALGFREAD